MIPALPALFRNNRGFTMTEVIVAILILMIGMVGLLQALNIASMASMKDQVRDEAVNVGQRAMNDFRAKAFDNISVNANVSLKYTYGTYSISSRIRNSTKKYYVTNSAQTLATQNGLPVTKQLQVLVNWQYKGVTQENRVISPISILR